MEEYKKAMEEHRKAIEAFEVRKLKYVVQTESEKLRRN